MKKLGLFLLTILLCFSFVACANNNSEKEPENLNYDVVGIWKAEAEIHRDNPYNYGGDTFLYEFYMEYNSDGTMRNRAIVKYNGVLMNDTDWINANATYTVEKNTIKISTGKNFVVVNDEIHDTWSEQNITLRYKKTNN